MNISSLISKTQRLANDNAPLLLTCVGVAGVVTTAYLTHKAALQAEQILSTSTDYTRGPGGVKEKARLTWKVYIPPISVAAVTCASIVFANRIGTRRAAAVAAAYTISERVYDEYKAKVVEKLGESKEREIRDEIAQDRVNRTLKNSEVIITTTGGTQLFLDAYSGRYFESDMETVRKAINDINFQILHADYATLDEFYDMIGLETTSVSGMVGWNTTKTLDASFTAALTDDDRKACIVMDFTSVPFPEPHRFC